MYVLCTMYMYNVASPRPFASLFGRQRKDRAAVRSKPARRQQQIYTAQGPRPQVQGAIVQGLMGADERVMSIVVRRPAARKPEHRSQGRSRQSADHRALCCTSIDIHGLSRRRAARPWSLVPLVLELSMVHSAARGVQ